MMDRFNGYQSAIEMLEVDKCQPEIKDQFYDFVNNVPYIKNFVSSDRLKAKDLEKDEEGKIIIDITKPHILEDMDYFRPSALHYQETGRYTDFKPNSNPNSEFGKWIREERRRCLEGYVRESDGEWITGDYYFFLNYCPIQLAKKDKRGKTIRVIDFPNVWDGHYLKTHYLYQCRMQGKHAAELSRRGSGKSYVAAAMLAKRFILGESVEVNKKVQCVATASEKKYIQGANQILDMFQYYIDFCANNTEWPSRRITNSLQNLQWTMGYVDVDTNTRRGTQNSVIGITSKDDESKLRGSRGVLYLIEEAGTFPRLLNLYSVLRPSVEDGDAVWGLLYLYGCVCAGTKVYNNKGEQVFVENLKKEDGIVGYDYQGATKEPIGTMIEPHKKPCVRITLDNGNYLECSEDHPVLRQVRHKLRIGRKRREGIEGKRVTRYIEAFVPANDLVVGDRICEARKIDIFGQDNLFDARLVGLLIGDGSYGFDKTPTLSSKDIEIQRYVKDNYDYSLVVSHVTKEGKLYEELRIKGVCSKLREIGIYGQTGKSKRLPTNYQSLNREDIVQLLGGLYDTDGYVFQAKEIIKSHIVLTQANKEILEQVRYLLRKFGIISCITVNKPHICSARKDRGEWYNLHISGILNVRLFCENIPLIVGYKKQKCESILRDIHEYINIKAPKYDEELYKVRKVVNIESIGEQYVYNLSAMNTHTYLANDIITHNTSGDRESDFSSMQELMYNGVGYNILTVPNVYDKEGQGRARFTYFFPGYLNRDGCYDHNGNSDVTKALLQILKDRYTVKYNSTDINAITKRVSEIPITPQEAILRSRSNIFPVTQLNERLNEIDNNPNFFDDVYVGELTQSKDGKVEFRPTGDKPIRDFPTKDNKVIGAMEIYEMPKKMQDKIPQGRYIASLDNYDNDTANTMSLGSLFVLDLWTDRIVAEYTGRPMFADDLNEIARKICIFYNCRLLYENNKRGTFAYFSKMNALYMLEDTPEYLKQKQLVRTTGYGNSSKGVTATVPIKNHGFTLIRDWLLKPVIVTVDDSEVTVPNLHFIRNRALIKELILFNPDINVDRVMSMVQLMIFRESQMVLYGGEPRKRQEAPKDYAGNDPFFTRNYHIPGNSVSDNSGFSKTQFQS